MSSLLVCGVMDVAVLLPRMHIAQLIEVLGSANLALCQDLISSQQNLQCGKHSSLCLRTIISERILGAVTVTYSLKP